MVAPSLPDRLAARLILLRRRNCRLTQLKGIGVQSDCMDVLPGQDDTLTAS
jgi:hypothetical protein